MHPSLDLWHMRVFVAVVEAGGFGRAARALGVAQSTVSEALASLERGLGVDMFVRSGRQLTLTPAGDALLPHANLLLRNAEVAVADVARVAEQIRTTVTIVAPESVGSHVLPAAMAAVRRRWPGIRFHVEAALCPDIRAAAASGRPDVGLVLEPASMRGAGEEVLRTVTLALFGRSGHPLAGRRVAAGEISKYGLVFSEAAGHYHTVLRSFFEAAGYPLPHFEVAGSVEAVRRSVLAADALGALPAFVVDTDLAEGRAAAVTPVPRLMPLELKLLPDPCQAPRSPMAQALVDALRASDGEPRRRLSARARASSA